MWLISFTILRPYLVYRKSLVSVLPKIWFSKFFIVLYIRVYAVESRYEGNFAQDFIFILMDTILLDFTKKIH